MGKTKRNRALSLLLCAALLFSQIGVTTYAEGAETGGLCEHHPKHTLECGYAEVQPGAPCEHEHTEDCYRLAETCVHEHTTECYPEGGETDDTATPSDADKGEPSACSHVCSEETGCITEALDCPHERGEHDDTCGYVAATPGRPCGYICELCDATDKGSDAPPDGLACICAERCGAETGNPDCPVCKDDPEQCAAPAADNGLTANITGWAWLDPDGNLSEGALALPGVSPDHQADFDTVVSMLPKQISATVDGGDGPEELTLDGWACEAFRQDENENWPVQGAYTFAAALPEGYALGADAKALEITVTLGGANTLENDTGAFTVTGGISGTDYTYANNTLTVKTGTALTISGTTTRDNIVVARNVTATLILSNVTINVSSKNKTSAIDLSEAGACTITSAANTTNKLTAGRDHPGIYVPGGNLLTLNGTGEIDAQGGYYWPGIGRCGGGKILIESGTIVATGGGFGAGIGGSFGFAGGEITITGGTVTANGSDGGAGIGGGNMGAGGTIAISGGTVTANGSGGGAGIGGGNMGAGGNITITGGAVTANGGTTGGAGIGGGNGGGNGTFSTALNNNQGNAFIAASSISDEANPDSWSGVIFEGTTGKVYGSPITLTTDAELPVGKTLTVGDGQTLILGNGATLTNYGTITVESGGELNIANGVLNNFGTLDGTGIKPNDTDYNNKKSTVTLAVSSNSATYGDSITLTATVAEQTNTLLRSIPQKTVVFYCGNTELGTATVNGRTAEITISLTGADWKSGSYSLHAEYTGGNDQLLPAKSTAVTLIVNKAEQTSASVAVSSTTATYGSAAPTITLNGVTDNPAVAYYAVSNITGSDDTTEVASISGTTITLNKAGTFYVKAAIAATDCYNAKTVYSEAITVGKADSGFTATVKKGSTETSSFTYGDTITVEVSGIQVKTANLNALSQDNVYLFATEPTGSPDASSAIASAAVSGGSATLTYNTSGKKVSVGTNQKLWIAYGGSGNLNPATQTVTVNLTGKPLTAEVDSGDSSATKSYDGNAGFSNVKLTLSETVGGDTVTATATGTASDSDAGNSKTFTATSVTLGGANQGWYSLAVDAVSGNVKITKADGATILSVTGSCTGDGSTFTYTVNPIDGAEYSKDNSAWQDSNVFTGFTTGSVATTFYARMKEDNNHNAGASSNTGAVIFSKLDKTENPTLSYQISGATGSKEITITAVPGCEYTFDNGTNWGSTHTHTFDTDGEPVIGIRYQETATHKASAGAKQTVDLKNQKQPAPGAFTLIFTDNGDGTFTAAIPTVPGGEYSFDGGSWSGTNTKADCQASTPYTGYARLAAKDGYDASPATSDTKTTPRLIVADPVIAPNGGSFSGSQSVTITTATPDAKIYYTMDGSSPSGASTVYTGAFTLTGSATVQAIALKDGYENSGVISAVFTKRSSSGGGGGSDDSGNSGGGQTGTTTPTKPDAPTIGTVTPTGKPDQNGHVSIPGGLVTNAINEAVKAAEKSGQTKNGVAVAVNLPAGTTSATLDRAALDKLIASGVKSFKLNYDGVALAFDLPALKELAGKTTGTLTFGAAKAAGLTGDALAAIGTRPAYNLTVSYTGADGKAAIVQNFGAGVVSVALAYTPTANELTGSLYAVYASGGKVEWLEQSSYDRNGKAVIFQTGHFSTFGVGYKAPPAFTDTVNHWAKADIDFVASRGLFSGTSKTTFAPNGSMTRGAFVAALGRLAGIDPAGYPSSSRFNDVAATAYYAPFVEWAAGKGIVNGTGENAFSPDATITREQMAAIMRRYADKLGYTLPVAREAENFTDAGQITSGMKDAVQAMQQAGVMNGKGGQRFGPKDTATRAEAAAVLRRFVEIVIDPATAGGWAQNDSGAWLYYQNGKPVTGWKQVESRWYYFDTSGIMQAGGWKQIDGKWYYFNEYGVMAVNTKIDGYEVGPDGARK